VGTEWTPLKDGRARTLYPVIKVGLSATDNSTTSPTIRYDKLNAVSLYFGAAGVWEFAKSWRAQLELTTYDKDELMLSVGLRKTFGGHKAAALPLPSEVTPELVTTPLVVTEPIAVPPSDSDNDAVVDTADKCPTTPANDKVDASGCSLSILLEVYFDNDSGQLKATSYKDLDRLIQFMQVVPTAAGELQGHTDSVGKDSYNLSLSQRRADAVKTYLVSKGIPAERLTAKGYGETQPVADNATTEGRAQNRRVLFVRKDAQ
jgi:outer membrane protein OmpA-like peptidoglycan-associated protein